MKRKCSACGAVLKENMTFCVQCGCVADNLNTVKRVQVSRFQVMLSCILSVLAVLCGSIFLTGISIRHITKEKNVETIVERIELSEIRTGFLSGNGRKETLADFLYDNLDWSLKNILSRKQMEKILDEDYVKEFVTEQLSQYVEDIFENNGKGVVKEEEIEEFLEDNREEINDVLGYSLPDYVYEDIVSFWEDEDIEDASDLKDYRRKYNDIFDFVRITCSYPMLYFCAAACLISMLIVICISRWKAMGFGFASGIWACLAGIQFALYKWIRSMCKELEDEFPIGDEVYKIIVNILEEYWMGLILVLLGVCVITALIAVLVKVLELRK